MEQLQNSETESARVLHLPTGVLRLAGNFLVAATVIGGPTVATADVFAQDPVVVQTTQSLKIPMVSVTETIPVTAPAGPNAVIPNQTSLESLCPGPESRSTMQHMISFVQKADTTMPQSLFNKVGGNPKINTIVSNVIRNIDTASSPQEATAKIDELTEREYGFHTSLDLPDFNTKHYLDLTKYKVALSDFASYTKLFPPNVLKAARMHVVFRDGSNPDGVTPGQVTTGRKLNLDINSIHDVGIFSHELGHIMLAQACNDVIGKDFAISSLNPINFDYTNQSKDYHPRAFFSLNAENNVEEDFADTFRGVVTDDVRTRQNVDDHTLLGLKFETSLARIDTIAPGSAAFIVAKANILASNLVISQKHPQPYTYVPKIEQGSL